MHEAVFEPGKRMSTLAEGYGMGLAIVKKIAEYYGGGARVAPEQKIGTTMEVVLPGLSSAEPPLAAMAMHLDDSNHEPHVGYDPPHGKSVAPASAISCALAVRRRRREGGEL